MTEEDFLFLSVYSSKHSKITNPDELQFGMSLSNFLKYKEYIEILEAYETAYMLDEKDRMKTK